MTEKKKSRSWIHQKARSLYGFVLDHCDLCGLTEERFVKKHKYDFPRFNLSNRTGIYDTHHWNWWILCVTCHRRYDRDFLGQYPQKGKFWWLFVKEFCQKCKQIRISKEVRTSEKPLDKNLREKIVSIEKCWSCRYMETRKNIPIIENL